MPDLPKISEGKTIAMLRGQSRWNDARREFSSRAAQIEQAGQQRTPLDPLRMRAMEFDAVEAILKIYGVKPE